MISMRHIPSSGCSDIFRSAHTASDLSVPGTTSAIPRAVQLKRKDKEARIPKRDLIGAPTPLQSGSFCCKVLLHFSTLKKLRYLLYAQLHQLSCCYCFLLFPSGSKTRAPARESPYHCTTNRDALRTPQTSRHPPEKCACSSISLPCGYHRPFARQRDLLGPGFTLIRG